MRFSIACLVVALVAFGGCGGDEESRSPAQSQLSQEITTPNGRHVVVKAHLTTARSRGQLRPAACGTQRGVGAAAQAEINDTFCVYPGADQRSQGAIVLTGSRDPDVRIVASAPADANSIRLSRAGLPPLAGTVLSIPRSSRLRLALLAVPENALPGEVEITRGGTVLASVRLDAGVCRAGGRANKLCATSIQLSPP
jgi:hypothetical protein